MANRVLLGNKGGTYGLWVSKPGVDVISAADWDLLFVSDSRTVRMITSGTVSVPASTSAFSTTISFGLTAPTNSGVLAGTHLASNGRMIEGIGSYFTMSMTNTSVTFTKQLGVSVQFNIVWHLISEVGGIV